MKPCCSPVVVSSASLLSAVAGAAASDLTLRTVAMSGGAAPGLPGLTFEWFSDPRIAPAASPGAPPRLAFWADLAGAGVTESNNGSIWSDRSGSLAMLYRENDAAPVGGDIRFGAIPGPAFAADGSLAFTASLTDPAQPTLPTNLGLFAEGAGGLALRAREGEPAPGFPAGTSYSNLPVANFASGTVAFEANNGAAIWYSTPTGTNPRVRAGAPAPGGATTIYYGALQNPMLQPDGGFAFAATTFPNATQTGQPTGRGVWHALPTASAAPIAVSGTQAASTGFFNDLSGHPILLPGFGTVTRVAYWSSVTGPGVTTLNDAAIFLTSSSTGTTVKAREGDGAPGVGPGVFFGALSRQPAADAPSATAYFLAFRASIVGDGVSNLNNSGIWLARQFGSPVLIAREGEQVPRLPAGTLYSSFSDPIVNSAGQVVFLARLRGTDVTPATSLVLMMAERASATVGAPVGRVAPIVRTGDSFQVAPGDSRIVDEVIADMGQAGAGFESLSDSGVLFFKLGFKDPIVPPPPPPQLAFTFTQGLFTATVRCLADVNADGALSVADFGAFQTAYVLADLRRCDFNGDGLLTVADFGSFQTAFVQACP